MGRKYYKPSGPCGEGAEVVAEADADGLPAAEEVVADADGDGGLAPEDAEIVAELTGQQEAPDPVGLWDVTGLDPQRDPYMHSFAAVLTLSRSCATADVEARDALLAEELTARVRAAEKEAMGLPAARRYGELARQSRNALSAALAAEGESRELTAAREALETSAEIPPEDYGAQLVAIDQRLAAAQATAQAQRAAEARLAGLLNGAREAASAELKAAVGRAVGQGLRSVRERRDAVTEELRAALRQHELLAVVNKWLLLHAALDDLARDHWQARLGLEHPPAYY